MLELAVYAFAAAFVAIAVLGHGLLVAALIQCARQAPTDGRRMRSPRFARATSPGRLMQTPAGIRLLTRNGYDCGPAGFRRLAPR
jgi:hypothetical protein